MTSELRSSVNIFIGHKFQQNTNELLGLLEIRSNYMILGAIQFNYTLDLNASLQRGHPKINFRIFSFRNRYIYKTQRRKN